MQSTTVQTDTPVKSAMREMKVLQTVKDMLDGKEGSLNRVSEHPSYVTLETLPFDLLAPYNVLVIVRGENKDHLKWMLNKMQHYAMDPKVAKDIYNNCNQSDMVSVVHAVCSCTEEQLNIVGV